MKKKDWRAGQRKTKGEPVAKVISCDCGYIARGETEEELLADAESHIRRDHPERVGDVTQEQLWRWRTKSKSL